MKKYFQDSAMSDWKADVVARFPEEQCGLFVNYQGNTVYCSLDNVSDSPEQTFELDSWSYYRLISRFKVEAVLHSHSEYPHASLKDMQKQVETGVPWGIMNVHKGAPRETFFFGDSLPIQDLLGRPFVHGVYDCYSLVRDFYRFCEIELIDYPRTLKWWDTKKINLIEDNCYKSGFKKISREVVQPGDLALMTIGCDRINHLGVYIDDNLVLHHLINRLSRREPFAPWSRRTTMYMRYQDAKRHNTLRDFSRKISREGHA